MRRKGYDTEIVDMDVTNSRGVTEVADRLGKVPGVRGTKTYLAFRAYSRHDLEAAFALGLEAE